MKDGNTIFDRLWEMHTICTLPGGNDLLALDRIFLHDLCGTFSLQRLSAHGRTVRDPERVFAMPDHTLSTRAGRCDADSEMSALMMPVFRRECQKHGIPYFEDGSRRQGIVHVVVPTAPWARWPWASVPTSYATV